MPSTMRDGRGTVRWSKESKGAAMFAAGSGWSGRHLTGARTGRIRMSTNEARPRSLNSSLPPGAWGPLLRAARLATRPLERFLQIEAASGVLLLLAAAFALGCANSPWSASYFHLWHTPLGI